MRRPFALAALALSLTGAPCGAVDTLSLQIDDLANPGVRAHGILVGLKLPGTAGNAIAVTIADLDLGAQLGHFRNVRVDCANPVIAPPIYSCETAVVVARSERFGDQRLQASVRWNGDRRSLGFSTDGLSLAGGHLKIAGTWTPAGWDVRVDAETLALAELRRLLGPALRLPADWTLDGKLSSLSAQLAGGDTLQDLRIDTTLKGVNLANPDGTTASADFGTHLNATAKKTRDNWQFTASLDATAGEVLTGRWYWNFGKQAMRATSAGQWLADGSWVMQSADVSLGTMLAARMTGRLTPGEAVAIPALRLTLTDFDFAALPPQTRDGALAGTIVSQLQGSGHFSGAMEIENDAPAAADFALRDVTLEDVKAKLAMSGLNGRILWQSLARSKTQTPPSAAAVSSSELRWKSGLLYGVSIGGAAVQFNAASNDIKLSAPARIPILDGGLSIRTLQLRHLGESAVSIRFDSTLEPISVPLLCKAFGWPEFAGTLSGQIPNLNLEAGVLTLGGALQAAVFDGEASVRDLKLSDPFGARPRLQANVTFDRLDLAAVTGAFSFGKITGRISGFTNALELVGWEPVAFDASLFTTPGDRSRHRISQRAVQNISSIGGGTGAAAALQRGVLRFFNEFNYAKLGLSCTLANDVCLMRGIEPHAYGYYLVKGSGLPRIDVIGDAGRIDWPSLVASLKQLSTSEPTVGKPP